MCWPAGEQVMVGPPSARRAAMKKRAATCDPHVSDFPVTIRDMFLS